MRAENEEMPNASCGLVTETNNRTIINGIEYEYVGININLWASEIIDLTYNPIKIGFIKDI